MKYKIPMEDDRDMFRTFMLIDKFRKHPDLLTKKDIKEIKELGININKRLNIYI
jgi:hypothetical protein